MINIGKFLLMRKIHKAEQKLFKYIRKNPEFVDWADAELRAFIRRHKDAIFKE